MHISPFPAAATAVSRPAGARWARPGALVTVSISLVSSVPSIPPSPASGAQQNRRGMASQRQEPA